MHRFCLLAILASFLLGLPTGAQAGHPCWNDGGGCYHWPDGNRSSQTPTWYDAYGHALSQSDGTWAAAAQAVVSDTSTRSTTINQTYGNAGSAGGCPDTNGPPYDPPGAPNAIAACVADYDAYCNGNWEHWGGCAIIWYWLEGGLNRGHVYGGMIWFDSDSYYTAPGEDIGEQHSHPPALAVPYTQAQKRELICHEVNHIDGWGHSSNAADCVETFNCHHSSPCQIVMSDHEISELDRMHSHSDPGWSDLGPESLSPLADLKLSVSSTESQALRDFHYPGELIASGRPYRVVDVTGRPELIKPAVGVVYVMRTKEHVMSTDELEAAGAREFLLRIGSFDPFRFDEALHSHHMHGAPHSHHMHSSERAEPQGFCVQVGSANTRTLR